MHSDPTSITTPLPLPLASPLAFALALAIVAPGCVLDITDFKESATTATTAVLEDTTSDGSTSDGSSTSVASTTTTADDDSATTLDTDTPDTDDAMPAGDPGELPACHAFTEDPEQGSAEACAAELGCDAHTSGAACYGNSYHNANTSMTVGCRWGVLLTGLYIEDEQLCDGEIKEDCRAAIFNNIGGPPCNGYYHDFGDSLEVLSLECTIPLIGDWTECHTEDGVPDFKPCSDCFPKHP